MSTERTRSTPPNDRVSPAEDRNRQIAAAAWILGWIGGPLPAVAMLVVTRTPRWSRRLVVGAAVFWSVTWLLLLGLVFAEARGDVPAFPVWWIAAILIALGATIYATRVALRRSERSGERASW
jgi:hypothetical protein